MTLRIGILIFDDAEELDFVGPYEVFTMARALKPGALEVQLIAERDAPVRCAKGMRVLPDAALAACGPLDILLVPGGQGTRREVENKPLLDWIAATATSATWV
ncbi:MAG TPA: DJ-1/PfpI family protein, partial [Rhizomicrobium sp.]